MKFNKVLILLMLVSLVSCKTGNDETKIDSTIISNPATANPNADQNATGPQITFPLKEKDFGIILQGEVVFHRFKFKNTGDDLLIINKVSSTCGCTVAKYTEQPLKPGEEGEIEVSFDSGNRRNYQEKTITVLSNATPNRVELKIKANIVLP